MHLHTIDSDATSFFHDCCSNGLIVQQSVGHPVVHCQSPAANVVVELVIVESNVYSQILSYFIYIEVD